VDKEFLVAKEYIHKESVGNEVKIKNIGYPIINLLEKKLEEKKLEGFEVFFINREEKARKKLIFSNYKKETKVFYPFFYIAVQFVDVEGDQKIETFLLNNGCTPIYLDT
jgi:hypothetical protein